MSMKKPYQSVFIEVVTFETNDVLTVSMIDYGFWGDDDEFGGA